MFINIKDIPNYKNFQPGKQLLISHIKKFLHCEIEFVDDILIKYPQCIQDDKSRIIKLNKENILFTIYIRTDDKKNIIFALRIKHPNLASILPIINIMLPVIHDILNQSYKKKFLDIILKCGSPLLRKIMALYLTKTEEENLKVSYLIELFTKLRTYSFENVHFTTGIIFAKNINKYSKEQKEIKIFKIKSPQHLGMIQKRYWFMVDGTNTFFLCNRNLNITHVISYTNKNYTIDHQNSIKRYLGTKDILFSVEKWNNIRILTNKNIDFLYNDSTWNIRDYKTIRKIFKDKSSLKEEIINALFFYLLYCSKNHIGTLIWLPKNITNINKLIISKHRILKESEKLSVLNPNDFHYITRSLESDGVTIIDNTGTFRFFGCIIKLSRTSRSEMIGTGESVGHELSKNGIGIKVSKDGKIKLFFDVTQPYIIF